MVQRVKFASDCIDRRVKIDKDVWAMASGDRNLVLFSVQKGILDSVRLTTENPGWLDLCVYLAGQHIVALSTENYRGADDRCVGSEARQMCLFGDSLSKSILSGRISV